MNLRRVVMMVAVGACCAAVTAGAGMLVGRQPVAQTKVASVGSGERFEWVDVFVKADGGAAVGAWQVEMQGVGGQVQFVGVEGGEGGESEPPLYDAAALSGGERLVIGAVKVGGDATKTPPGLAEPRPTPPLGAGGLAPVRVRVARVHVRAVGALEYAGALVALSDLDGKRIGGTIELVRGEAAKHD